MLGSVVGYSENPKLISVTDGRATCRNNATLCVASRGKKSTILQTRKILTSLTTFYTPRINFLKLVHGTNIKHYWLFNVFRVWCFGGK